MRKALVLVALASLLISTAAFAQSTATTTYTETLYPSPIPGGFGENWVALRGVPLNPDPAAIFPDMAVIDDGRLGRLNPVTGNPEGYYSFQEPGGPFGSMLLGDGYKVVVQDTSTHSMAYTGIVDGVPDAAGTKTDMWISLPGLSGANGGLHWVGNPFDHNVPFVNIKVTDGTQTLPVLDAITAGWLQGYWTYMDAPTQNPMQVDPDGLAGSDSLEPGRTYEIVTFKSNIALIIPAT